MRTWRLFALMSLCLLVISAIAGGIAVTSQGDEALPGLKGIDTREPPAKQAVEAEEILRQATAEAGPHAPKPDLADYTPLSTPQSCPIDPSGYHTAITGLVHQIPSAVTAVIGAVNEAGGLTNEGAPYSIWSGASRRDRQQGAIAVWLGAKDPCAEGRTAYDPQAYYTPFKGGAVTLTKLEGDTLDFRSADGTTGRFDFVTGVFE